MDNNISRISVIVKQIFMEDQLHIAIKYIFKSSISFMQVTKFEKINLNANAEQNYSLLAERGLVSQ